MRALTVIPGTAQSLDLLDMTEPYAGDGPVLVRTLAIGLCGTDAEIVSGQYGWPPKGAERLIIGHESLGEVIEAPAASGFRPGDHVVGVVRRPDSVPCMACGRGEWDAPASRRW